MATAALDDSRTRTARTPARVWAEERSDVAQGPERRDSLPVRAAVGPERLLAYRFAITSPSPFAV